MTVMILYMSGDNNDDLTAYKSGSHQFSFLIFNAARSEGLNAAQAFRYSSFINWVLNLQVKLIWILIFFGALKSIKLARQLTNPDISSRLLIFFHTIEFCKILYLKHGYCYLLN